MEFFEKHKNTKFTVQADEGPINIEKEIDIHALQTGYNLQTLLDNVKFVTDEKDHWIRLNLDDYFAGFRTNISIMYPNKNNNNAISEAINDANLIKQSEPVSLKAEYQFNFISQEYRGNKILTYMYNDTYAYLDSEKIYVIDIQNNFTNVTLEKHHGISGYISNAKYYYGFVPRFRNDSDGTLMVQYSMNGNEQVIKFLSICRNGSFAEYDPITYSIGRIIDIVIYRSNSRTDINYIIVGAVTKTSHYSLIIVFEEDLSNTETMKYNVLGRLTASNLGISKFVLESLAMYEKNLLFTNDKTLYVVNIETFVKAPDYFTPMQVKSILLDPIIYKYSQHLFKNTYLIAHINVVDH